MGEPEKMEGTGWSLKRGTDAGTTTTRNQNVDLAAILLILARAMLMIQVVLLVPTKLAIGDVYVLMRIASPKSLLYESGCLN